MQSSQPTKQILRQRNRALKKMGVKIPKKIRAQRQPKKQGRRNKQNRNTRSMAQRNPGIDRFPLGNRQGTGFGRRKTIIVSESEFISEVAVSNQPNFNVALNLPINPGQASTFPWLSTIAKQYEKYCFRSLQFVYKPEVTQFNPTSSAQGKVMLSCDYDASDAPPASKQQVEDTDPHADCMPYERLSLSLDPRELHKNSDARFVRPAGLPGGNDIKTYDCGNLYVSNQGQTGNGVNLGELHVVYTVELSVPILESQTKAPTNYQVTSFQDTSASLTTSTPYQPLLAAAASTTVVNVNGLGVVNTAGSIVPPPGNYTYSANVQFVGSGGYALTYATLQLLKNGNIQNQGTWTDTGSVVATFPISISGFITCNGTDAITLNVEATFGTGSQAATTVFTLVAN